MGIPEWKVNFGDLSNKQSTSSSPLFHNEFLKIGDVSIAPTVKFLNRLSALIRRPRRARGPGIGLARFVRENPQ